MRYVASLGNTNSVLKSHYCLDVHSAPTVHVHVRVHVCVGTLVTDMNAGEWHCITNLVICRH